MRTLLLATLVTGATVAPAVAGPAKYCDVVVDAAHDENLFPGYYPGPRLVDHSGLDLVRMDMASDATTMTIAFGVRQLVAWKDGTGVTFGMRLNFGHDPIDVEATVGADGSHAEILEYESLQAADTHLSQVAGYAAVRVDHKRNEVRMTFPLSWLAPYANVTAGTPVHVIYLRADALVGSAQPGTTVSGFHFTKSTALQWDEAPAADDVYRMGAPSCLHVDRF